MPRSYQVTPGILGRRRATQPKKVRPKADSMEKGQPAADREPSRPHRTPPPDARRLSLTWKAHAARTTPEDPGRVERLVCTTRVSPGSPGLTLFRSEPQPIRTVRLVLAILPERVRRRITSVYSPRFTRRRTLSARVLPVA